MARDHFVCSTFSELQDVNRSPIDGYQDLPLLTLEEAIGEISLPISNVMDYVATAKKNCNRSSTLLTWDESAAIYLYSMPISFFTCLNEALRAENRHALKPWFAFLKLFTTALEKLPSTKRTVWRRVSGDISLIFADGDVHIWWSVNSCSMDLKVVEQYLDKIGTVFAIDITHGKDVSAFSAFPDEQEVVLMPGTRVRARCQSLNIESRFFLVHLEEDLQSESQSQPNYLFEMIRQKYQENAFIERIMNPAKTIPIQQSYINLAIVESKEQQEKEKKLGKNQPIEAILGTFEEIYGVKSAIDVKDIFKKCEDHPQQMLIFGRAGIGKTTFCRYVTYQWATGAIWQQYELVIFIQLRSLTKSRYPPLAPGTNYSPLDLVKKEYFHHGLSEKDEKFLKEQLGKSQVLWLLDGYDEIIQNVPEHLQYAFEQLLRIPHHILTSRPYLNTLSYNVQLEITGFTDDNIENYVEQFFDQIKDEVDNASFEVQKLVNFLRYNPRIWGISHIPVNLELICSLWCDIDWSETTTPTMTTVYNKMAEWLCRRHLEKQDISSNQMIKEVVYAHCAKELAFLESLAFNAIESNSVILRPELLRIAFKESGDPFQSQSHLLNIGVLKSLDYKPVGTRIEADKNHYFVHLSFQEYFAAQYLIKALNLNCAADQKKKAVDFIKSHKYNQRFELVFTFAAGLLTNSDTRQCINPFWDTILGEPLDLIGVRHVQLLIACIEESACNRSLPKFHESMKLIIQWIKYSITKQHDYGYKHVKASLQRCPLLINQSEILKTFVTLHQNEDPRVKKNAYFLITALPISNTLLDLSPLHLAALDDEDDRVKEMACKAVGEMSKKLVTNNVIDRLVSALSTGTYSVRKSAHKALVKMGENSARDVVISRFLIELGKSPVCASESLHNALADIAGNATSDVLNNRFLSALRNTNDLVRCGACRALGQMCQKVVNIELINRLAATVRDENVKVRESACYALGKIDEKAASVDVIDSLMTALGDVNQEVRFRAIEALGKIGNKAATAGVIKSLIIAVGDPYDKVRQSACYSLGEIDEKAVSVDVINSLVNALGDVNQEVRFRASEALGKIGEKAASVDVINSLVTALRDVNQEARFSASVALGKIGEKAATAGVIKSLIIVVGDPYYKVRQSACYSLGEVGEKAVSVDVINNLVNALGDVNQEVRFTVSLALVKIGEKAASVDVINNLATGLRDVNEEIRCGVCEALGKIVHRAATTNVINSLIIAVYDESDKVRQSACYTLGKIVERAARIDVINSLANAVRVRNPAVRWAACDALGKIGEKAAINKMIDHLLTALEDENDHVRWSACEALERMVEKVETIEVFNALVRIAENRNSGVKSTAYFTLWKVCKRGATDAMIDCLVNALGEESIEVTTFAYEALHVVCTKGINNLVTSKLATALRSENYEVRCSACRLLGIPAGKAAGNEVIDELLDACFDNYSAVKNAAAAAIGSIFRFCSSMSHLKPDTVLKLSLCVNQFDFQFLRKVSPDRFVKSFLDTEISFWLPVIKTVSLQQGYGITVTEDTVVLYSSQEPLKLHVSNREICKQLKDGLINSTDSASEMDPVEVSEDLNRTEPSRTENGIDSKS